MEPLLGDMPLVGALSLFFLKKPVSASKMLIMPLTQLHLLIRAAAVVIVTLQFD